MNGTNLGEFPVGSRGVTGGLVKASETEMRIGLFWVQCNSLSKGCQRLWVIFFLKIDGPQVEISEANVILQAHGGLQKTERFFQVAAPQFDVAEISESMGVAGIEFQFALESGFGVVILLELPVQKAESKIGVGLARRCLDSGLKLDECFLSAPKAVESISGEDMSGGGIRVEPQDFLKLYERTRIFLSPEAALRQNLVKFGIGGIPTGGNLEVLGGFGKPTNSVVAHAQQGASLQTFGICDEGRTQRSDCGLEVTLLEFSQSEIQLNPRESWVQCEGLFVCGGSFRILLLPGEIHAKAGKGPGIARVLFGDCLPDLGGLLPVSLLLKG